MFPVFHVGGTYLLFAVGSILSSEVSLCSFSIVESIACIVASVDTCNKCVQNRFI